RPRRSSAHADGIDRLAVTADVTTFAVDTNCILAVVCEWHERHHAAMNAVTRRIERRERLVTPALALVEAYAVLTRLPAPHRMSPSDAWRLLNTGFVAGAAVVGLSEAAHVALLTHLAKQNVGGGRVYDRMIAECAREAAATVILTFNVRHFDPPPEGLSVIEPA